jgi:hypothetical protein
MLNPEHMLLPYSLSDLPAGPWLVFAPHADDESQLGPVYVNHIATQLFRLKMDGTSAFRFNH